MLLRPLPAVAALVLCSTPSALAARAITVRDARVYALPDDTTRVVALLDPATELAVTDLDEVDGWRRATLADGSTGWVRTSDVELVGELVGAPPRTIMRPDARPTPVAGLGALVDATAHDPLVHADALALDDMDTTSDVVTWVAIGVMAPVFITGAALAITADHPDVREVGLWTMGGAAVFGAIGALIGHALAPSDAAIEAVVDTHNQRHPTAPLHYVDP